MDFNIIDVKSIGSTNLLAQELIDKGAVNEGDVIFTHKQESGRGQGDNFWESECGANLTISLILEPKFISPTDQFVLTQLISLAIAELLESYFVLNNVVDCVKIKWPNDIYIDDKKIGGILFQNLVMGNIIDYSIVGIGINVNQKIFYSNAKNPASLIHYFEQAIPITEILENLLKEINIKYELLRAKKDYASLKKLYISKLYQFGDWCKYYDKKNDFYGRIVDVDGYGRLTIEKKNGEIKQYMHKEVEFL